MGLKSFYFIVFIFCVGNHGLFSQTKDTVSIPRKKISIKPTTDFDQRFSIIRDKQVSIWGQRIGILINEKFKVGVGGYFLNDRLKSVKVYQDGTPESYLNRNLTFGTMYIEPFFLRKTYYEFSIVIEAGLGRSYYEAYDSKTDNFIGSDKNLFFPTGAGLSLSLKLPATYHIKPLRWIGINFLAGYRYDLFESVFQTDYDGLFYSISGALFLDRISDDYKEWKRKKRSNEVTK